MGAEPPLDVRDRGDERDRSLALLAVDSNLEAVLVVGDVSDSEVLKLPALEAGIELERDSGVIAGVARAEGFLAL